VEIEGIAASALDADIFGVWAQRLKFRRQIQWDPGLGGSAEYLRPEGTAFKLSQIPGLHVFEVDQNDFRFQLARDWLAALAES
jgi:hypothetical protein